MCGQEGHDEIHFVFHCQAYTDLRKNYSIFDSPIVQSGINYLRARLASKNKTKIIALPKCITEAMKGEIKLKNLTLTYQTKYCRYLILGWSLWVPINICVCGRACVRAYVCA